VTSVTSNDFAGQAQQACAQLTQDQHVFVVFGFTIPDGLTTKCLIAAKTPVVGSQPLVDYAKNPDLLYNISAVSPHRSDVLLDVWHGEGLLQKGSKVGIVWVDDPNGVERAMVNNVLKPRLQKMGITPSDFALSFASGNIGIAGNFSQ